MIGSTLLALSLAATAGVDGSPKLGESFAEVSLSGLSGSASEANTQWNPQGVVTDSGQVRTSRLGFGLSLHASLNEGDRDSLFEGGPAGDAILGFTWTSAETLVENTHGPGWSVPPKDGDWGLEVRLGFPWRVISSSWLHVSLGLGGTMVSRGVPGWSRFFDLTVLARVAAAPFSVPVRLEFDQGVTGMFDGGGGERQLRASVGPFGPLSAVLTWSSAEHHSKSGTLGSAQFENTSSTSYLALGLAFAFGG